MAKNQQKILVVYYSLDGNTEFIARIIADTAKAAVLKLQPKKEIKSKGFMKYFLGGMQVIFKKKPLAGDRNANEAAARKWAAEMVAISSTRLY